MRVDDENFIFDCWLKAAKAMPQHKIIPSQMFFPTYRKIVGKILAENKTVVATAKDDDTHILAFRSGREASNVSILSFCYIKESYRDLGLDKALVGSGLPETVVTTHFMPWIMHAFPEKTFIYNPFLDLLL